VPERALWRPCDTRAPARHVPVPLARVRRISGG
jgi:hypothetical protein